MINNTLDNFDHIKECVSKNLKKEISRLPDSPLDIQTIHTKIIIKIEDKSFHQYTVKFSRDKKLSHLIESAKNYYNKYAKEKIISFKNAYFVVNRMTNDLDINRVLTQNDESLILKKHDECLNNPHYNILSGEFFHFYYEGVFKLCEAEIKKCVTSQYNQGLYDYYKCITCSKSRICKNCIIFCHDKHIIETFKIQHESFISICHCPENINTCLIKNRYNSDFDQNIQNIDK